MEERGYFRPVVSYLQYLVMDRQVGDISRYFEGYKSRGVEEMLLLLLLSLQYDVPR